jgi:deazaflavin-dependent oxidoreductase (nitroreductase family)
MLIVPTNIVGTNPTDPTTCISHALDFRSFIMTTNPISLKGTKGVGDFNVWNRKIIDEFRANGGKVGGMFEGSTLLLLHSKGAKSQRERVNPLAYVRDGGRFVVIAVGHRPGVAPTNPDWYYNLVGSPEVTVEVGAETFRVLATVAEEPELTRLYDKMVEVMRAFDDYRHKTTRKIPVIVLTPMK